MSEGPSISYKTLKVECCKETPFFVHTFIGAEASQTWKNKGKIRETGWWEQLIERMGDSFTRCCVCEG